jgi:parallel beta-helix repeat protein/predicted outer membrane repeat protein
MKTTIILVAVLCMPALAFSATIYVPDDHTAIQRAINASMDGDTIIVRPGTYVENIDFLGKAIAVQSEQGPDVTIIDGGQAGSVVSFKGGENLDSLLDGFTVTNGSGTLFDFTGFWLYCGGGVYCDDSSPTLINNTINVNLTEYAGGGIFCHKSSPLISHNIIAENQTTYITSHGSGICCYKLSSPTITENTIIDNWSNFGGGGIGCTDQSSPMICYNTVSNNKADISGGGIVCYSSSPSILNNKISDNSVSWSSFSTGGGIYCLHSSTTISNNIISGNWGCMEGGGIYCDESSVSIQNNVISGNEVDHYLYGNGGGIYSRDSSLDLMNNRISQNKAYHYGGGIYCDNSSSLVLDNNVISGNSSKENGGGIWSDHSTLTLCNNIILGNTADVDGGGIYCQDSSQSLFNNTFSGNEAGNTGGGICSQASFSTIVNTILYGNTADIAGPEMVVSNKTIISYCDLKGGKASIHVLPGSILKWGEGMIDSDPLLAVPGYWDDNGTCWNPYDDFWVDGDFHLTFNSPCRHGREDARL